VVGECKVGCSGDAFEVNVEGLNLKKAHFDYNVNEIPI
jgi:hypothetical protein